jgi:hypothetical protein
MLEGMGRMYRRLVERDACENRENRGSKGFVPLRVTPCQTTRTAPLPSPFRRESAAGVGFSMMTKRLLTTNGLQNAVRCIRESERAGSTHQEFTALNTLRADMVVLRRVGSGGVVFPHDRFRRGQVDLVGTSVDE